MPENYHHVIPRSLHYGFTPPQREYLNTYQILLKVKDHDIIEALLKPIVYLVNHGFPRNDDDFVEYIQYVEESIKPAKNRLRGLTLTEITCICGYVTRVNTRSSNRKRCRHCNSVIFEGGKIIGLLTL